MDKKYFLPVVYGAVNEFDLEIRPWVDFTAETPSHFYVIVEIFIIMFNVG